MLQYVDIDLPPPGPSQARVRHTAIGVNFIDTYHRTGLYPLPLPSGLGSEAAGVVEAVGEGVTRVKAGDRVGYASGFIGSYAQAYYLGEARGGSMHETVMRWRDYLPRFLPLPHPSWRNTAWLGRNPWFENELLPELRARVHALID